MESVYLLVALGAIVAGFVQGLSGFAFGMVAMSFRAWGLEPRLAATLSVFGALVGQLVAAFTVRRGFNLRLLLPFVLGGLAGGWLVTVVSPRLFDVLIPWLILLATAMFAFSATLTRWMSQHAANVGRSTGALLLGQFVVSIYGGFFGGGMGIMMLALYSLFALDTLTRINALKTWLSVLISGVAVLTFIVAGLVDWPAALVMLAGTICGGVAGARLARRLPAQWLKRVVVALGSVLTAAFFWKVYG